MEYVDRTGIIFRFDESVSNKVCTFIRILFATCGMSEYASLSVCEEHGFAMVTYENNKHGRACEQKIRDGFKFRGIKYTAEYF